MVQRVLGPHDDGRGRHPAGRPVRLHRRRRVPPRLPARPRDVATASCAFRDEDDYISQVPARARPLRRREDRPHRDAGAAHHRDLRRARSSRTLPRGRHRRLPRRPRAADPHRHRSSAQDGIHFEAREEVDWSSTARQQTLDTEVLARRGRLRGRGLQPARHHRETSTASCSTSSRSTSTPSLTKRRSIFCATDDHADMVVDLLKEAFAGEVRRASTTTRS